MDKKKMGKELRMGKKYRSYSSRRAFIAIVFQFLAFELGMIAPKNGVF